MTNMTKRRTNIYIDDELAPIVDSIKAKLLFGTDLEVIKYALRAVNKLPSNTLEPVKSKEPPKPTVQGPLHLGLLCPIHKNAIVVRCGCIKKGLVEVIGINNINDF